MQVERWLERWTPDVVVDVARPDNAQRATLLVGLSWLIVLAALAAALTNAFEELGGTVTGFTATACTTTAAKDTATPAFHRCRFGSSFIILSRLSLFGLRSLAHIM